MPKGASKKRKRKTLFTSRLDLNLRNKIVKCYIWRILRKVDQKYPDTFEMWCWRMMEVRRNDSVRNEDVLHGVKEEEHSAVG